MKFSPFFLRAKRDADTVAAVTRKLTNSKLIEHRTLKKKIKIKRKRKKL